MTVIDREIKKDRKASLLFLTCSLERIKMMANEPPRIIAVMEYVNNFLSTIWLRDCPILVQIMSSGSGALFIFVLKIYYWYLILK